MTDAHEGPPRYYRPICIRWPWGFEGGPSGYEEVGPEHADSGPIIVEAKTPDA